jgi:hypothetical protein
MGVFTIIILTIFHNNFNYRTQVKRIVVTSSVVAIFSQPEKPTKFSENDWNTISTKEVDDLGIKASPMSVYSASKTLAERGEHLVFMFDDAWLNCSFIAAWDFYNQNKSEVLWDLVTVIPSYVRRFVRVSSLLHVTHYSLFQQVFGVRLSICKWHPFLTVMVIFNSPQSTTSSPFHP